MTQEKFNSFSANFQINFRFDNLMNYSKGITVQYRVYSGVLII